MDINTTLPLVGPIADTVTNMWQTLQVLVGGIFGLYIVIILLRIYEYKNISKTLKEIKEDIKKLKHSINKK